MIIHFRRRTSSRVLRSNNEGDDKEDNNKDRIHEYLEDHLLIRILPLKLNQPIRVLVGVLRHLQDQVVFLVDHRDLLGVLLQDHLLQGEEVDDSSFFEKLS